MSRLHTMRLILFTIGVVCWTAGAGAQETAQEQYGTVTAVSGQSVTASMEAGYISVGDEVEIYRTQPIIDPVTNEQRGRRIISVAVGVVRDFSLGTANINILQSMHSGGAQVGDRVRFTGRAKQITRTGPRYGNIEEINDDEFVTSLGTNDDISEGDIFLIQRTESVIDPETNEVTGTKEVNVGRLQVASVDTRSSTARPLEMKMEPRLTDNVVKESEYLAFMQSMEAESTRIDSLESEVADLREEVQRLRAGLHTLRQSHESHLSDYSTLKQDIESLLDRLMAGDIPSAPVRQNRVEVEIPGPDTPPYPLYRVSLEQCLNHEFVEAIAGFRTIIDRFPGSELVENSRYWIAQANFTQEDYTEALDGFREVIEDTRFNHKDDDASIMLGITHIRLNEPQEALAEFRHFMNAYPESEYRGEVERLIRQLST